LILQKVSVAVERLQGTVVFVELTQRAKGWSWRDAACRDVRFGGDVQAIGKVQVGVGVYRLLDSFTWRKVAKLWA
jgi:hypothetical protein